MANEGDNSKADTKTSLAETKSQSIAKELDLDKNPVKYKQYDGTFSTDAHDKDYMELVLRSGQHSELAQKIMRQRIEMRAKEFPRWPADATGGVRSMWLESRFSYDRERLSPDFDADWRNYRAKYLHSLELDPREPVHVPEYEQWSLNPIRKFLMKPGDFLEDKIIKKFARDKYYSATYRVTITRGFMMYCAAVGMYYLIRFNHRRWDSRAGPDILVSAPVVYPGDPRYPFQDYKTLPQHFDEVGFLKRNIFKDLRDWVDSSTVL